MNEEIKMQKEQNLVKVAWKFLKKETVFAISLLLAVISAIFVPPSVEYIGYLDLRVLALLFCLMLIVAGIRQQGIFGLLGRSLMEKVKDTRQMEFVLVMLCFFSSMLITNDVALITFVPFTIELLLAAGMPQKIIHTVVLQTIAANLGSMLTPVGNPQNLYLYSLAEMNIGEFLLLMLPLTTASFVLLAAVILFAKKEPVRAQLKENAGVIDKGKLIGLIILFIICLGTVARIVPWQASFLIVCIAGAIRYRDLFADVDYCLLGTFAGFFVFVGNMQNISFISEMLQKLLQGRELLVAIGASQIISNVPAAMLLSGFTSDYKALLYGVDVGGLGTLIASLASLISYKFYANSKGAEKGRYLLVFTLFNLAFLLVLFPVAWWLM